MRQLIRLLPVVIILLSIPMILGKVAAGGLRLLRARYALYNLGTNLDAESSTEVNQASFSVLDRRAARVSAVFSTELCGSEAIKFPKYFISETAAIRIGNQSYSISHCLFSFVCVEFWQLRYPPAL
jgi:hypothetical protein